MKHTVCFAAMLILLAVTVSAATIEVPNATLVTSTLDLPIQITDVADLYAYQFDITFNPMLLRAASVSEGPFLSGGGATLFLPGAIDNTAGTITLTANALAGPVPGVSGSGVLATIRFLALDVGVSPIMLSNVILLNSASGDISADVLNGSVRVAIPEPSTGLLLGSVIALGVLGRYWLARR